MKIKRFIAADMRSAIRQVKESLGADAVILSNKPVEGGVEIVAARDYDEDAFLAQAEDQIESVEADTHTPEPSAAPSTKQPRKRKAAPVVAINTETKKPRIVRATTPNITDAEPEAIAEQAPIRIDLSEDPLFASMQRELAALRRMMQTELSVLSWRQGSAENAHSRELMRRLMNLDLTPEWCQRFAAEVADIEDLDQAWRKLMGLMVECLPVQGGDLLEEGGAIALVGPTGVGKTTTVAKLAARHCLRHGNRDLALITTDHYRIGAHEQLHTYGRILDVPVRTAATLDDLNSALSTFASKRLVLIDTAGMSQRDVRLSEQLSLLTQGHKPIRTLLTLSAATQFASLRQALEKFSVANPSGCVLTKTDEAARLGGALSVLMQSGLPLAYVTDGQKVPEDLHLARANNFINRVVSLEPAESPEYSEEFLALTFGGSKDHVRV